MAKNGLIHGSVDKECYYLKSEKQQKIRIALPNSNIDDTISDRTPLRLSFEKKCTIIFVADK